MNEDVQQGWWSSNWKWFVPTGCGCLLVMVVLFFAGIAMSISTAVKSSEPYTQGVALASDHPLVVEALGEPIEAGLFVTGGVSMTGSGSGNSNLDIPLSGPRGKGKLYVVANKLGGQWDLESVYFVAEGGTQRLDLLKE